MLEYGGYWEDCLDELKLWNKEARGGIMRHIINKIFDILGYIGIIVGVAGIILLVLKILGAI